MSALMLNFIICETGRALPRMGDITNAFRNLIGNSGVKITL
jgi:hypothetical protein